MRTDGGRVWQAPAVVLHRRAYRETSLLLEVFSAEFGRLRLLAKGAMRPRALPWRCLQPFVPLRLSWSGRGDLAVLTEAEPLDPGVALEGAALFCGFYLNELVLRLLPPEDPYPEAFRLYLNTLVQLGSESERECALRFFEIALLEEIGYGLGLDRDAAGTAIDPARRYTHLPEQGLVAVEDDRSGAVHGATLLGLKQRNLNGPDQLREAKWLMRQVIEHHLEGRALKSRELFKAYGKASSR